MSLRHILLGLLQEPTSGYDLGKRFDHSLRHFWAADLAQIYPLLARMEGEGLLSSRAAPSGKGPPRKLYRRTVRGSRELLDWLKGGPIVGSERLEYLAQVFFLHADNDPSSTLDFFSKLHAAVSEHLEQLRSIDRQWMADDPRYPDTLPDEAFYPQLTLSLGLKKLAAIVEWCEECQARIKQR